MALAGQGGRVNAAMSDPILVFVCCWIALPIFPIVATWGQFSWVRKSGAAIAPEPAVLLLLVTISYFWILAGLVFNAGFGPDYSSRRFATIWINLGVMTCLAVWALIRGQRLRWLLVVSCVLTASVWLYAAMISVVV